MTVATRRISELRIVFRAETPRTRTASHVEAEVDDVAVGHRSRRGSRELRLRLVRNTGEDDLGDTAGRLSQHREWGRPLGKPHMSATLEDGLDDLFGHSFAGGVDGNPPAVRTLKGLCGGLVVVDLGSRSVGMGPNSTRVVPIGKPRKSVRSPAVKCDSAALEAE